MSADWVILAALLAGALVTYGWRALGVLLSGRLDPESRLFEWITCVAYALLAALMARMLVFPTGPLAETELVHRLLTPLVAVAGYFLAGRSILVGSALGAGSLALFAWLGLFV